MKEPTWSIWCWIILGPIFLESVASMDCSFSVWIVGVDYVRVWFQCSGKTYVCVVLVLSQDATWQECSTRIKSLKGYPISSLKNVLFWTHSQISNLKCSVFMIKTNEWNYVHHNTVLMVHVNTVVFPLPLYLLLTPILIHYLHQTYFKWGLHCTLSQCFVFIYTHSLDLFFKKYILLYLIIYRSPNILGWQ